MHARVDEVSRRAPVRSGGSRPRHGGSRKGSAGAVRGIRMQWPDGGRGPRRIRRVDQRSATNRKGQDNSWFRCADPPYQDALAGSLSGRCKNELTTPCPAVDSSNRLRIRAWAVTRELWRLLAEYHRITTMPRSDSPRWNAVVDAPRRPGGQTPSRGRRASRNAFPRRAWERVQELLFQHVMSSEQWCSARSVRNSRNFEPISFHYSLFRPACVPNGREDAWRPGSRAR